MAGKARKPRIVTQQTQAERDSKMLKMLSGGATYADIAFELLLSESTVKDHLAGMRQRLGALNNTHAVSLAYERGILEVREHAKAA